MATLCLNSHPPKERRGEGKEEEEREKRGGGEERGEWEERGREKREERGKKGGIRAAAAQALGTVSKLLGNWEQAGLCSSVAATTRVYSAGCVVEGDCMHFCHHSFLGGGNHNSLS